MAPTIHLDVSDTDALELAGLLRVYEITLDSLQEARETAVRRRDDASADEVARIATDLTCCAHAIAKAANRSLGSQLRRPS
jgi:hypothetical protein